ncbi:MAG: 16S rRNA (adenine(1518)-N(6)/adenine(1519)-N(6))-dimethyltransferase RsmA [Acidobacteria bacterium]|jgi:16S rRNA (adenine1518-N6/adenine1519-N6)-dimethyltransferase|nr:16S rRNA (adenine(1518)-N(6)/adenine(1519)-N(6))-dimethyltransferase RsmA [Acidobacteriota bacterium]
MPRRLGQHFLKGAGVGALLGVVDPARDEVFLEIGPGEGALTKPLAERAERVVAVELDGRLARRLRATAPANVEVVEGDALKEDLRSLVPPDGRLVGNLPYYVSSPLLRRILDLHDHVRDAHVMLQEEVARRIASPPGSREYGILSILYALWADVDLPLKLPPGAFRPPPRVSSALLRARFREEARAEVADLQAFEVFLKQAFARRRRTLENNLQDSYPNLKEYLRLLNLEGSRRAETLSVVEFVALWRALKAG